MIDCDGKGDLQTKLFAIQARETDVVSSFKLVRASAVRASEVEHELQR